MRRLAFYGKVVKPAAQVAKSVEEKKLRALVERRRQLLGLINQENNRLQQTTDQEIGRHIKESLQSLKKQVETIDTRLAKCVKSNTAHARKVEILVTKRYGAKVEGATFIAIPRRDRPINWRRTCRSVYDKLTGTG